MEQQRIVYLLEQYYHQRLSPAESRELQDILDQEEEGTLIAAHTTFMLQEAVLPGQAADGARLQALINQVTSVDKPTEQGITETLVRHMYGYRRWRWAVAAAIFLLVAGAGWVGYWQQHGNGPVVAVSAEPAPGKTGAILTLSDGSQVALDSSANGVIARQNGANVVLKNGRLAYAPTGNTATDVVYNTIHTPRGRQYQADLPDGTKVWLNAASSVRYPTIFSGPERKVEVTGEVYFEVAKNAHQPFYVQINESTSIEVLGTHFNINAYQDEASINTTVLEGAIRLSDFRAGATHAASVVLRPGQQAKISNGPAGDHAIVVDKDVDESGVLAWKNGLFSFHNADLPTVMRQLARWYDVEVVYAGAVPVRTFNGKIGKSLQLSQVLRLLSKTRIKYTLEDGRRLVILPD